jgi:CheY-like chemotaxis protein
MTEKTGFRILIADDNPANLLALRLELQDRSWEAVEAANGNEALELLAHQRFDAVVSDVWMPGADGIELVRTIRAVHGELTVFVVTGGGPGLSIASAKALAEVWGADRVYIKPFDVRKLADDLADVFATTG